MLRHAAKVRYHPVGALVVHDMLWQEALKLALMKRPPGRSILAGRLTANGYAEHSPGGYSMVAGFPTEGVLTFFFIGASIWQFDFSWLESE